MCRARKFTEAAYNNSLNSCLNSKHGCVITKNGKIIVSGYNHGKRTKIMNVMRSSIHAEMDAAYKLIKILKRKYGENYINHTHKYTLWVVRSPNFKHEHVTCVDSKPCFYCVNDLKKFGFNKIAYSNENGEIEYDKLQEMDVSHKSSSQKVQEMYF